MRTIINLQYSLKIWGIAVVTIGVFLASSTNSFGQSVSYPVKPLGNCRDAQECYLYCQIPAHTPACWSYGKYILPQVLGEQTSSLEDQAKAANITFPIPELGNCQSALACFTYCSQAKNQSACRDFARKNGLTKQEPEDEQEDKVTPEIIQAAQTELGCTSRESCQAICSQAVNAQKCRDFAIKYKIHKESENEGSSEEVIKSAKNELGCTDQATCSNYCSLPENREKCHDFAKKHKLIDEQKEKTRWEHEQEKRQKLMEEAKETLGCTSFDECKVYCAAPEHNAACREFSQKHTAENQPTATGKPSLPCEGEKECKAYCEKRPEECKGYKSGPSQKSEDRDHTAVSKQPEISAGVRSTEKKDATGNFLGPSGCKTESECKAYCEKHPSECPGFPKTSPSRTPSVSAKEQTEQRRVSDDEKKRTATDPKKFKNLLYTAESTEVTNEIKNESKSHQPEKENTSSDGGFGNSGEDK